MSVSRLKYLAILPLLLAAAPAQAYIGPGVGGGAIAAVLGVLASIAMAFVAVIWYPIKRLVKKRKPSKKVVTDETSDLS